MTPHRETEHELDMPPPVHLIRLAGLGLHRPSVRCWCHPRPDREFPRLFVHHERGETMLRDRVIQ